MPLTLKPNHKVITDYYRAMQQARDTQQVHEGAVAPHFAALLRHCLNSFPHLDLVEQYAINRDGGQSLRADGAIVDKQTNVLVYGIWEAKDSQDKLEREVQNKFVAGYPDANILFQSPDQLILYQQGVLIFNKEITKNPEQLIEGIELFLSYKPPAYGQWEAAISAFKDQVGALGQALVKIILTELKVNKTFTTAFEHFSTLCKATLNPNLAPAAVIEMLVQHLLTERLFRTIFNNPEFINNNVIAREIEAVIRALTSRSFSRHEFLHSLDRFYLAIEETASTIHAYSRKQEFLNAVYENFFQGFAVKVADTHGIVYTPQPIVEFMVNSVQEILHREFNEDLANPGVQILDPFVGTGNFILRIMQEIASRTNDLDTADKLRHKYHHELHCNEILLLPYYIASMNIEHAYYAYLNEYAPFTGICLVDTFELAEPKQRELSFVPENTERVTAQQAAPIFVIIGNPPYNVGQQNENDANKNRKYPYIDEVVAATYAKQSQATLKNKLSDAYIKAFAWATERLQSQDKGIIAFVSNNGFLDGIATDGMRKQLGTSFSKIFVFDLKGNVRRDSMRDGIPIGEKHTIFGLSAMVGIAITFLVKKPSAAPITPEIHYAEVNWRATRLEKFAELERAKHWYQANSKLLQPDLNYTWLTAGLETGFATFMPMGSKASKTTKAYAENVIFQLYGLGISTNRDTWVYNFASADLSTNMQVCIDFYNEQVFRYSRTTPKPNIDGFVTYEDKKLSWSSTLKVHLQRSNFAEFTKENIRKSLYRPFAKKFLYFDNLFIDRRGQFPSFFPIPATEQENRVICLSAIGNFKEFQCLIANVISDLHCTGDSQCFPFYTYNADGSHRQENITDWALQAYQTHYQDSSIDKWAIFYYVYGLLHHSGYRTKYAANLKRELPRIPYASNFWPLSHAGQQLATLHLTYETQPEYPLTVTSIGPIEWRVTKMRLNKDKTAIIYNDSLTLGTIPPAVFEYRLGNRSALEWIIDQYQISTDNRSGIINDPNRRDDERYIVRLLHQIITVSLETVRLVAKINTETIQ